jgi:hypothetical protein
VRVKVAAKYPDANSLSAILLDWDEERLNALPSSMQRDILSTLDRMHRAGEIKTIQGEEEFNLVKEGTHWRVYLDWAAGIRVSYNAIVPPTDSIEAVPVNKSTTIRPSELFTIAYRVRNRTAQTISTRITHLNSATTWRSSIAPCCSQSNFAPERSRNSPPPILSTAIFPKESKS